VIVALRQRVCRSDADTVDAAATLSGAHVRRYIIGLPLFQKNAVEMSRQMIGQAKKFLGSSVIGYELGNEVRTAAAPPKCVCTVASTWLQLRSVLRQRGSAFE
jgi:hypothetical protein